MVFCRWKFPGLDQDLVLPFDAFIMELATVMTVNEISALVGEHDIRLWRIIKHYVNQARAKIESQINNGILEGINSVVQTVKRKARGFRNIDNFITAIYLKCSKLKFDLP